MIARAADTRPPFTLETALAKVQAAGSVYHTFRQ